MRPTTVRASLVAILLVVQAITLSILLVSVQRETETLFREHARATMSHLAETVADRTRRFLLPAEAAIGIGRQLVSDGVLHSDSDVDLERYFLAQLRASADVAGIFLGRRDGSFVYVMRNADGFRTKFIQVRDGVREVRFAQRDASQRVVREWADAADRYDPRTRPWYTRARRNEGMIWTDPYMFYSSRRPGITAAIALQSPSGADGGVIGVDVELLSLSGFVSKIPIGRHGSAVIRDDRGVAVASSSADRLVASFSDEKLPAATEIAPPALQALLARVPSPGKDRSAVPRPAPLASGLPARVAVEGIEPDVTGFHEYFVGGDLRYGYVRPFPTGQAGLKWLLAVEAPASDFSGGIDLRLRNNLLTFLAIVALVCVLGVVAVLMLTRPIAGLHRRATRDALTGVHNRDEFMLRLGKLLGRRRASDRPEDRRASGAARRAGGAENGRPMRKNDIEAIRRAGDSPVLARHVALVALDLDGFKRVNDAYGHGVGDEVLKEFARRLGEQVRRSDLVGRVGGDEFVLALSLAADTDVLDAVERIREAVIQDPFRSVAGLHALGVTAGVAIAGDDESLDALMRRADQALIVGKACRKNRTYLSDAPMIDTLSGV